MAQPHVQPGQFDLRLTSCFLTIYTIPQVAAAVVVLSAKENSTCDSALGLWVIVNSVRLMISLGIFWVLAIHQASQSRCLRPSARCAHAMYQPMMLVSWVWLVVGTLWVMGTDNCQTLAPELFDLSVAMVSMAFLWLFMPLVIFIVLVPFAICCSPFHRRLLRYLQVTQPTPPGRGAEPEQLERVPTTVYRKKRVEDGELLETACPVCFVDFSEGQQLRQPHCGHVVCDSCGKQWWSMNAVCPICREPIMDSDGAPKPPAESRHATAADATAAAAGVDGAPGARPGSAGVRVYPEAEQAGAGARSHCTEASRQPAGAAASYRPGAVHASGPLAEASPRSSGSAARGALGPASAASPARSGPSPTHAAGEQAASSDRQRAEAGSHASAAASRAEAGQQRAQASHLAWGAAPAAAEDRSATPMSAGTASTPTQSIRLDVPL